MTDSSLPTIALGSDHAGYPLKQRIKAQLDAAGYPVLDLGTDNTERVDYPDYARKVADAVGSGQARFGIVFCGTGIGVSIAVNRDPRIRCALAHDVTTARLGREHNDANVLALGARTTGDAVAADAVRVFLEARFQGGRHAQRVAKLGLTTLGARIIERTP